MLIAVACNLTTSVCTVCIVLTVLCRSPSSSSEEEEDGQPTYVGTVCVAKHTHNIT